MTNVEVGQLVEIVQEWVPDEIADPQIRDRYLGKVGVLVEIDDTDDDYRYSVDLPDDEYGVWCHEVKPVERLKAGDRVEYFQGADDALASYIGRTGTVVGPGVYHDTTPVHMDNDLREHAFYRHNLRLIESADPDPVATQPIPGLLSGDCASESIVSATQPVPITITLAELASRMPTAPSREFQNVIDFLRDKGVSVEL